MIRSGAAPRTGGRRDVSTRQGVEMRTDAIETTISRILQLGVIASAGVIVAGVVLWAATGSPGYPDRSYPITVARMLAGLRELRPFAVIEAGLVLLVLTPIARVGASLVMFVRDKDRAFAAITAAVLVLLLISLVFGGGG